MIRVDVKPEMLRWARERAGLSLSDLSRRFTGLPRWERAEGKPTLKQLEGFAKATYTPVGYLFLDEPPPERLPLPDMRTMRSKPLARPSPNLLETIYVCQQRQAWYREFARSVGEAPKTFVGSTRRTRVPEAVAAEMRETLGFDLEARRVCPTWTEALRHFVAQADALGVLVMTSGVVLNNTHRKFDPAEFRGFALADDLAPLVFINGADTKSGQMFTLAHELAHIWLGQSALDDADPATVSHEEVETWCNRVAAEVLVPLAIMRSELGGREELPERVSRLARRFKVSTLVVLRRLRDADALTRSAFQQAYQGEIDRLTSAKAGSGGDFYLTLPARVSRRFARALVVSTLEGQTLYRDAFRMLGISKTETLHEIGRSLDLPI